MSEKEILIKFLDTVNDWVDSGLLRQHRLHYQGRDYLLGYRADRNARDFVSEENAKKDEFTQDGEYRDIRFVISGRMRRGDKGQKIRQYRLIILNGCKNEMKPIDLNSQLRGLLKGMSMNDYKAYKDISDAIRSKSDYLKRSTLQTYAGYSR